MKYFIIICLCLIPIIGISEEATKSTPISSGYFNPDVSVILESVYQQSNPKRNIGSILRDIKGFSNISGGEVEPIEGINPRESELVLSSNIDPYFTGYLIASMQNEGAGIEEAVIQTTALPYGFEVKAGKMFSSFGRINSQHSHVWDFIDRPLIYQLTLGEEGLNDVAIQASYLAPTDYYLLTGIEAFQGNNELMFNYSGEGQLPAHSGPRVLVGWVKIAPNLPDKHALELGTSFGRGITQVIGDNNSDGTPDDWLDGYNQFWGLDAVYKYKSMKAYGEGNWTVQGEYFNKQENLTVKEDDLAPLVSQHSRANQDGYYIQTTYGIFPRWQAGLRWEQVGLTNKNHLPDGTTESFGATNRESLALTYRMSEFSYLRLQYSDGNYRTSKGSENVSQVFLQLQISLGKHGAHKF